MSREDIANTLVDIYIDHGLIKTREDKDVGYIHSELNRMVHTSQPESQAKANKSVAAVLSSLGIGLWSQRDYLTEHLYLKPETKVTVRKHKINRDKAIPLTDCRIRHDPELQNEMARVPVSPIFSSLGADL